jgi:threonine dehydratase
VIAGQGSGGLEICEDMAALGLAPDIVLTPASGGGLLAGISLAVKDRYPDARVIGVEPAGFDDHARSFRSGRREKNESLAGSICDALLTQMPGEITFEVTRRYSGEALSVSDDEVRKAMAFAFRELKLVVEPGGIVALAAVLAGKLDITGKNVAIVLSGGNADAEIFRSAISG